MKPSPRLLLATVLPATLLRATLLLATVALASSGCSSAAPPWQTFAAKEGGFHIEFPVPAKARRAHEGPLARAYIVSARDAQGYQYEVALFVLPKPLDRPTRTRLLAQVERGLTGRPGAGAAEVGDVSYRGSVARALAVDLEPGQRGRWLVFYDGPTRMFQLSVVGPDGSELPARAERFFASFRLPSSPRVASATDSR